MKTFGHLGLILESEDWQRLFYSVFRVRRLAAMPFWALRALYFDMPILRSLAILHSPRTGQILSPVCGLVGLMSENYANKF